MIRPAARKKAVKERRTGGRKRDRPARNGTRDKPASDSPANVLVLDIGGSKVKMLATGHAEPRKIRSGPRLTPERMVKAVMDKCKDWDYDAVSIGYPGLAGAQGPRSEPGNLGSGWVGFNFAAAFDRPVRIINDAAMQALGSYEGGRMLFLGLGTGLGSTLIAQNVIIPLELGELPSRNGEPLSAVLGRSGFNKLGKRAWKKELLRMIDRFAAAFTVDYVVLGGGNARELKLLPPGTRVGNNLAAFRGGFRLWHLPDVPTLSAEIEPTAQPASTRWRVL